MVAKLTLTLYTIIGMHLLHTVLSTFSKIVTRICLPHYFINHYYIITSLHY